MTAPINTKLSGRYQRIASQLADLFIKNEDPIARMATICALLHHKMPSFFWTGFYRLENDRLVVGPYQGPLACAILPGPEGVCWAAVQKKQTVIVDDVHSFAGHVACDDRSQSEIVVPVKDSAGQLVAVLDVDSDQNDAFGETDRLGLESIVKLIYG